MTRIGSRRKAIDRAWKREKELVLEGKGTRDWTKEQQQQIVDEGRATDEYGKAFAGHHMKNVATHPEYQEDPDNIQFLTTAEHKEAHGGNTHIPTNGFYDYKTGETHDFGDNPPVPCDVIKLSDPIYLPKITKSVESSKTEVQDNIKKNKEEDVQHINKPNVEIAQQVKSSIEAKSFLEKAKNVGKVIKKSAMGFAAKHPVLTALVVTGTSYLVTEAISGGKSSNCSSGSSPRNDVDSISDDYEKNNDFEDCAEENIVEESTKMEDSKRTSPAENDVPAHSQRYHTKNGVIWKEKPQYHRGGKKEE